MIDSAYFELDGSDPGTRSFCPLSLRRRLDGSHAIEEVDGTIDALGNRSGSIGVLLDGATFDAAQATYESLINDRLAQGFERR